MQALNEKNGKKCQTIDRNRLKGFMKINEKMKEFAKESLKTTQ